MTVTEARQTFGDSFSCTYYNGTDYVTGTFTYNSYATWSPNSVSSARGSFTYEGTLWLQYTATLNGLNTNPNYITVDLAPLYSIFDTTQIHTCIALTSSGSISTVYQSPAWDWYYDGINYHVENSDTDTSGSKHAYFTHAGFNLTYVCVDLSSQSLSSGYSSRAVFYGNGGTSPMRLYIGVPYVDNGANGQTGTFPAVTTDSGGGGGGDINVNVTVDNSGVESRLDDVNSGIADINSALYGQSGQTMPYLDSMENPEYHFDGSTIDDIDQTLRDVPAVISSAAWWWNLAFDVLHLDSAIWSLVPLLCILSLVSYMLWRW